MGVTTPHIPKFNGLVAALETSGGCVAAGVGVIAGVVEEDKKGLSVTQISLVCIDNIKAPTAQHCV